MLTGEQVALTFSPSALSQLIDYGALRPQPNSLYRVTFVGLAVADGQTYQFVPKLFKGAEPPDPNVMRQIVRALRRYASWRPRHHEDAPFLKADTAAPNVSAIAIADWIIRDYIASGIYRKVVERGRTNGSGQVSWGRTIEQIDPVFVRGRPYYLSVVTRSAAEDAAYFVSRLHRYLVEVALSRFGDILGYPTISLNLEPFQPFQELPPLALCVINLQRELMRTFTDRAIHLIRILLAFISATEVQSKKGLALYGMTSFYLLWEAVCASAIGNEREAWLRHIPQPKWIGQAGASQQAETFIPDIVTTVGDGASRCLLIADAKYYRLTMPPNLDGQPGVNDVAKQVWYEQCLSETARLRGFKHVMNIFVVPGLDGAGSIYPDGRVEFSAIGTATVGVTRLASIEAFENYAANRRLDRDLVADVAAAAARIPL